MTHSRFAPGEVKAEEEQMEKAHLVAQEEQRACTCVRCACADRQAGEFCTVAYKAGLNLTGWLAQKLDRQQKQCNQVSMLGAIWSNQTACSNKYGFVCSFAFRMGCFL